MYTFLLQQTVVETWRRVWGGGGKNFSPTKMRFFAENISILAAKISDDLFLVIDQVFRIFPLFSLIFRIFTLLDIVHNPCLTRKIPFFAFFLLFSYFRAHPTTLLLKILGARMHGPSPHLKLRGTVSPFPHRFRLWLQCTCILLSRTF